MEVASWSRLIVAGLAATALAHVPEIARAQGAYPVKPVRILVGFAPGGFTDIAARIVGQKLGEALGQQVIVDNRPGANGVIAGDLAAKAAPDGYTLFMSSAGLVTNPVLYDKYQRDPLKEFTAVTLVAGIPNMLVVHPSLPARTVKDLLALARSRPGTLTQASAGTGSPGHLSGELLQLMTGTKFVHVPYKGSGPAMIDLVAGHVELSFPTIAAGIPHLRAGKLRALGVTTTRRSASLPEVPTIAEGGVPGYEVLGWYGVVGPAGMPRELVAQLGAEIAKLLRTPDVREKLAREGAEPVGNSPEEFAAFIAVEQRKWMKVIRAAGIRPARL